MFYNSIKLLYGTCGFLIGGFLVNEKEEYKKQIVEMIEKIENAGTLSYLHTFIKLFLERWGK